MHVIHVSAECYPVAKTGGLGDVVGALPKFQTHSGLRASVVMPYYDRKFVRENNFDEIHSGSFQFGSELLSYQILKESGNKLGFELFLVHIPGLLDREEIYQYPDETEQFFAFQIAFLEWITEAGIKPDIVHCHDHHAGLIPFLMNYSADYSSLSNVPTVVTVHNAEYQGWCSWDKFRYLKNVDPSKTGLLDWNGAINPLAAAIKCCWRFTAVSPTYLSNLSYYSNGLEFLFAHEKAKGVGIINGIDTHIWDPETDPMIVNHYSVATAKKGKSENKKWLTKEYGLTSTKPLVSFIGRLVGEKGADLLPEILERSLTEMKGQVNFFVLGSGEPEVERRLTELSLRFKKSYNVFIGYNEELSHRIYAASDFLLMPSRVEPCGLNQLYSLRYGTLPIVRATGGLKDTVIDFEAAEGYGICFDNLDVESAVTAVKRAVELYENSARLQLLRNRMMNLDFSWESSANQYINLYNSIIS